MNIRLGLKCQPDCKYKWKSLSVNCKPMGIFPYLTALKHCHFRGMENSDITSFLQRVEHI